MLCRTMTSFSSERHSTPDKKELREQSWKCPTVSKNTQTVQNVAQMMLTVLHLQHCDFSQGRKRQQHLSIECSVIIWFNAVSFYLCYSMFSFLLETIFNFLFTYIASCRNVSVEIVIEGGTRHPLSAMLNNYRVHICSIHRQRLKFIVRDSLSKISVVDTGLISFSLTVKL